MAFTVNGFAQDTWTVAGSGQLLGSTWDPADANNDMTLADGVYVWTKSDVELDGTDIEFKVCKNHAWGEAYPEQNWVITPNVGDYGNGAGTYDVTITFNPDTKAITVAITLKSSGLPDATITSVQLRGEWDWTDGLTLTEGTGNVYTGTLDLSDVTEDQQLKLVINGEGWIGYNQLTVDEDGIVLTASDGDGSNFVLPNATSGYKTYTVTATWEANPAATSGWTLKIEGKDARVATITSVQLKGILYGETSWENSRTFDFTKGTGDTYTLNLPLDMTLKDISFFLIINEHWVGYPKLALGETNNLITHPDDDPSITNAALTLLNSTSGFESYTMTATWTPGADATEGWTLSVAGKDERVLTYYLVGDLTGGFPEDDDDTSKDVEMTKVQDGLYTYVVNSFDASATEYKYKLRANKRWDLFDLPESGKYKWQCPEAGNYTLTFMANVTGAAITVGETTYEPYSVTLVAEENIATISSVVVKKGTTAIPLVSTDGYTYGLPSQYPLIDLSATTQDYEFQFLVNGVAVPINKLTIEGNVAEFLVAGEGENTIKILNSTSGYQTYTATAVWTPNADASEGWAVNVTGVDKRVYTYTATFDNGGNWEHVYAYAWSSGGDGPIEFLGAWPGTQLTKNGDVYTVTINATEAPEMIIFNDGSQQSVVGVNQTANFDFVDGTAYVFTTLPGVPIWTSAAPVEADWGSNAIKIEAADLANVKVGDIIHVSVEGVAPGGSAWDAQVVLKDGAYHDLEGGKPVGDGSVNDASFIVTGDILTFIQASGLQISGCNYSTSLVTLEAGTATGSAKSIWVGNSTSWFAISQRHVANANNFTGLKAGDVIRVTLSEPGWVQFRYQDKDYQWKDPEAAEFYSWQAGEPYDFLITAEIAETLNTPTNNGLIINHDAPITQVELIPAGTYVVTSDGDWSTVIEMTESEGVYSAELSDMAGKFFVIAPNYTLSSANDGIIRWYNTVRPNATEGDWIVNNLMNYEGETKTESWESVWQVAADNSATLTLTYIPADSKFTITTDATLDVPISAAGYATYSNSQAYEITGAEAVYIVKGLSDAGGAELTEITGEPIPGGTGVIVKGTEKFTVALSSETEFADVDGNWLIGSNDYSYVITGTYPAEMGGGSYTGYILASGANGVGFYEIDPSDNEIAAHKAFLAVPEGSEVREFIGFGDTTGISNVNREFTDGVIYDLSGRRVENPGKGIYIMNGKKFVVK